MNTKMIKLSDRQELFLKAIYKSGNRKDETIQFLNRLFSEDFKDLDEMESDPDFKIAALQYKWECA